MPEYETGGFVWKAVDRKRLILDGVKFPVISRYSVSASMITIPLVVEDHALGLSHSTSIVGGLAGMRIRQSDSELGGDEVQSQSGWWMLQDFVYSF